MRQKIISELKELFYGGSRFLTEAVRNHKPLPLNRVKGVSYTVHHVTGFKYITFIHTPTGKSILKNLHVKKIDAVLDMAQHFFSQIDWTVKEDEMNLSLMSTKVAEFRGEVERLHQHLQQQEETEAKEKEMRMKARAKK
jgi:hypothetical protein